MQMDDSELDVRSLVAIGMSHDDIAALNDVSPKKLRRVHKLDLRKGIDEGNRRVLHALHTAASSGANMAATSLWVKARCGWRDTGLASQSGVVKRSKAVLILTERTPPSDVPPT